ncbi:hypothetical protein [Halomontanus rarus]|uniref:hypothetical protein n=1 Tax=Halomontanus rarus TaxID=3034020 RepID=UPI001A9969EA
MPDGELWDAIGLDEKYADDKEHEARRYVYIQFEQPKAMGRNELAELNDIPALKDRDQIIVDGNTISLTVIGEEPV